MCGIPCAGYHMRDTMCGIPYVGYHMRSTTRNTTSAIAFRQVYIFHKSPYYPYIAGRWPEMEERL